MAAKKSKSDKIVEEAFHEVHHEVPRSVKASGKTGAATQKMLTAIALQKSRAAGADVPEAPTRRKGSKRND